MTRVMTSIFAVLAACGLALPCAGESAKPQAAFTPVGLNDARWTGGLMGERFDTCRDVMVPNMWRIMSGTEHSQFLENFRIAAGLAQGRHRGPTFNDGDFYKWIEAASAVYAISRDEKLNQSIDESIAVIAKAQRADGYIHTPVLLKKDEQFDSPLHFEMYNMGHLMQAACVHHRATGKTTLLDVARKAADFLDQHFAKPTPELAPHGVCPSHYSGLVELSRVTNEPRYLALASRLIDMRDLAKNGTDDNQDRIPFRQQTTAIGHAVRANYLYAGAADVYLETGDATLLSPLQQIWTDLVTRKLYITGGCGALFDGASPDGSKDQKNITRTHQAYGRDYQLPNGTAHNETCAAIGSLLWNWRMLRITGDAKYSDLMETTLYNSVLTGVGQDGKTFFYTNRLRKTSPEPVAMRWGRTRQPYISVFCCPPNVVRTIAESATYAYGVSDDAVWVHLYGAGELSTKVGGKAVKLTQETIYPWDGKVRLTVTTEEPAEFAMKLRVPGWVKQPSIKVNGQEGPAVKPGTYAQVRRTWSAGDVVELDLPMPARLVEANPAVEETRNHAAVMRGPIVYCVESPDLPQGVRVDDVRLPRGAKLTALTDSGFFGGNVGVIDTTAHAAPTGDWSGRLYRELDDDPSTAVGVRFVPYFAWGNRGDSEMTVWVPLTR